MHKQADVVDITNVFIINYYISNTSFRTNICTDNI